MENKSIYSSPKELLSEKIVSDRFKTPQEIGTFLKNLNDKVKFYYTSRKVHIHKESFINFLKHINKFNSKGA